MMRRIFNGDPVSPTDLTALRVSRDDVASVVCSRCVYIREFDAPGTRGAVFLVLGSPEYASFRFCGWQCWLIDGFEQVNLDGPAHCAHRYVVNRVGERVDQIVADLQHR